ncbi:hypothetical protein T4A_175, partial [Trichinella pseudospiralis]
LQLAVGSHSASHHRAFTRMPLPFLMRVQSLPSL